MCLSIPGKILSIKDQMATIDISGSQYQAGTHLVENAKVGDLVLIHSGFIIQMLTPEEAEETREILREILKNDETSKK
ncbi:MAG: HypC/HybG/HupF family hydrogenase formation chaperone [Bacteroidetes bacterium]|jgi:hydrogenase expression/formation protein HypC|nr:HypC/HybG/HupF family hydrogenase formation chaperone [Bacteroidota bacterium]MBT3750363.1 HypC/HybG/HupF family hydrogenase formation chaperone [Bacteroidota bacterium]MBT4399232.1 HypC/HybG/HupF family hydrogenase formation chaperone [Bacteroidota bacterium]MBT4409984.1 HypC/HybG/HupF family hydrogenase formation chaperone [Bacteroidota bacterium]MBT5425460.1 HypC/HybG/HupF family hydrogenase formation chaperone [Bacteroidota bacterium]